MPQDHEPQLLLTRLPTDGDQRSDAPGDGWDSLPADLLRASARRVAVAAWAIAAVWLLAIFGNFAFRQEFAASRFPGAGGWPWPNAGFGAGVLAAAVAVALIARRIPTRPRLVINLGLWLEVVAALGVGLISWWDPVHVASRISWICPLLIVYPSIAPTTPRRLLMASFAAASMDPLGYLVANARGVVPDWPAVTVLWMVWPTYVCALLALVPGTMIRRLGRQVQTARQLGAYRLGRLLGEGGMGVVHEASHRMLARPAAVKLIRPELLAGGHRTAADLVSRFNLEAQTVARLRSPHTVQLYDYGVTPDGVLYYAMELLDGIDLQRLVDRHGPLPPGRVIHLLRQACGSLAEAHAAGLVHRDIKPSNLFLCRMGLSVDVLKVLDFGLVRGERGDLPVRLPTGLGIDRVAATAAHVAPGTPAFMAPEVAIGREADRRSDIYSLGCVAYWLLTARPVFDAEGPVQTMFRHAHDTPEPPSAAVPVPPLLDTLVLETLAKDPDQRVPDAETLSARLRSCAAEAPWSEVEARQWWEIHRPSRT